MITCKHSGDLGDIIFSIPTIKSLGSNILYLDPNGGESSSLVKWADKTKTKLDHNKVEFIKPLIEECSIEVREWNNELVDYDLDKFRLNHKFNNLAYAHLAAFKLSHKMADLNWLLPAEYKEVPEVIISRSCRYTSNYCFWEQFLAETNSKGRAFIGLEKEHEIFEYTFGHKIDFIKTDTIMDLRSIISNAGLFVSNQGLPNAIAEGMKHKNMICEVNRVYPAVVFKRQGVTYV